MIGFEILRARFLDSVRHRIRTGEITERALARKAGLSQPHVHNLLKGVRALNAEIGDQLMENLGISLTDLLDADELRRALFLLVKSAEPSIELPVLQSRIGPGLPWTGRESPFERVSVPYLRVSRMLHPVVARLGDDPAMAPLLAAGDLVLLDSSPSVLAAPAADSLFVVERAGGVLIRWIRFGRRRLYLSGEATLDKPSEWDAVDDATVLAAAIPLRSIYATELVYDPLLPPRDRPQAPALR